MDAIQFVNKYQNYVDEISLVVKEDFRPIINKMKEIDPHDFITPEAYFVSENHAKGFVWELFMGLSKNMTII